MEKVKIESKLVVKNEAADSRAKMYLYGTIRKAYPWEEDGEFISANKVRNKLESISGKDIDIHINSGGGDVFESIAIHNLLKQYQGEVDIYIDGLAGSGASIVAAAGKNVYMPKNAMQMIHKAWTIAVGNADELRKSAADLDKMDEAVMASYEAKFVGTKEELSDLLADETWLNASECEDLGFCTKVIEDEPAAQNNTKESILAKYKKVETKADDKPAFFNRFKNKEENHEK